jgi:hypothetical protein
MQPQLGIAQQIGGACIKTAETLRVELNQLPRRNPAASQGDQPGHQPKAHLGT